MKKIIISCVMSFIVPIIASAADYRGFFETGIVYKSQKTIINENNIVINEGHLRSNEDDEYNTNINISTTHGVQINKFLFIGGGADLNLQFDDYETLQSCNIFGAIRYDICLEKKWSPFVNLKIGYNVKQPNIRTSLISSEGEIILRRTDNWGGMEWVPVEDDIEQLPLYLNIVIGTRLRLSSKCGLNLSLNYSPIIYKNKEYSGTYSNYTSKDINHSSWVEHVMSEEISYEHAKHNLKTGHLFGFNIGIDF